MFTTALDDLGVAETLFDDVINHIDGELDALYEKRDAVCDERRAAKRFARKLAEFVDA